MREKKRRCGSVYLHMRIETHSGYVGVPAWGGGRSSCVLRTLSVAVSLSTNLEARTTCSSTLALARVARVPRR
jgi:hypothetical protein